MAEAGLGANTRSASSSNLVSAVRSLLERVDTISQAGVRALRRGAPIYVPFLDVARNRVGRPVSLARGLHVQDETLQMDTAESSTSHGLVPRS